MLTDKFNGFIKKHWPIITSLFLLYIAVVICFILSIHKTDGHFIYVIDDPYIHMALAKNFAAHGVWGITKYGFTSLASSLIWPLIISLCFYIFGVNDLIPLILNIIISTFLLIWVYYVFFKHTQKKVLIFLSLFAIIYFPPLVPAIFTGLEHITHTFVTLMFAYYASILICKNEIKFKDCRGLVVLAMFLVSSRYEGLFLIFVVAVLFMFRKHYKNAFIIFIAGMLPITVYGVISLYKGWYFFPNSILIKGNAPDFSSIASALYSLGYYAFYMIMHQSHFYAIILCAVSVFIIQYKKHKVLFSQPVILLVIFISVFLMHMQLADTDWFSRYEVYFMALGFFSIAISLFECIPDQINFRFTKSQAPQYIASVLLLSFTIGPFESHGRLYLINIPQASQNIYHQQYQMALFIRQFYQGKCVALNDIGAVNYVSDIKCLDLHGLANIEAAKAKLEKYYNTMILDNLAMVENAKIAILYDKWFLRFGGIPKYWIPVGKWRIPNNVVCAIDEVTFYAIDHKEKDILKRLLENFSKKLPEGVEYKIIDQ